MRKFLLLAASLAALTPASAQGPRYLDPRDVAEAQRQNVALIQELGGVETGPRAAYVELVGRRVAAQSGIANPGQALHFLTLNSPVENALSVPGGYVYITRQLLGLMNDEAELAFALGHETGHIAANHAHARQAYAQRQSVLGVLGAIFGGFFGDAISQRARMSALSFSRAQEYQADTLGLSYLIGAGYDPAGGPEILAALARESALESRMQGRTNRQTPEWASTHPLSENRMQRALAEARATGRLGTGETNRDRFLAQIDGEYVDDDPLQGIVDGPVFTHPDLRIQFQVPPGYLMSNGTTAVSIKGSAGQALFSGGQFRGSLETYILALFSDLVGGQSQVAIPQPQRTSVNGMPAAFTTAHVQTSSGVIDVSVIAYQWDAQHIYHFLMMTRAELESGRSFRWSIRFAGSVPPKPRRSARGSSAWSRSARPIRFSRWRAGWPTATSSWIVFS